MSFYVGQQVVCVNVDYSREPTWRRAVRAFPKLNGVYTIRSIRKAGDLVGFCFEEIVNPLALVKLRYVEPAFDSRRFRPVRKTSIAVFERLLTPVERPRDRASLEFA
jgi:hypothetical protein